MPNESSLKIRLNMKEDNGQSQKILKLPVPAQVESQALLFTNKMPVYYTCRLHGRFIALYACYWGYWFGNAGESIETIKLEFVDLKESAKIKAEIGNGWFCW